MQRLGNLGQPCQTRPAAQVLLQRPVGQVLPDEMPQPEQVREKRERPFSSGAPSHNSTRRSSRRRPNAFGNDAATSSSLDGCDPR